ncbi:MAG: ABC transporter permease, partial [Asgard group archaeon]|nr:ABC transporter permease [Asgard group archaeon]
YTFTLENTQQSSIVFTLLSIVLILVGALVGIGIIFLNGNMKKVFTFIFRKNAFFINFNFKKSRHRLSSIVIVMIILTTTTFYSAILLKTLQKNEQATSYYNNGSDFRIITQDTNYSYNDTIAAVEGIENVMPVMTTSGQYGFDRITVYGINPISYSSIGRWLESSFNPEDVSEIFSNYTSNEWLEILDNNYEATIISDGLAEKYHLNISTEITVTTLPIGATYGFDKFQITGIIHSAPGLGLATGFNIELKQTNEYYILVNQGKLIDEYGIVRTNLFFASLTPGYSIEEVKARLLELDYVVEVNPDLVSEGFSSQYVDNYVPDIKLLIISVISLVVLISIIILIINIDFILKQRKQENAIMSALGNTNTNLARMLLVEISVINLSTVITGFLISIPFVLLSIYFIMPFLTSILIIPMNLAINYTLIGILTALYIVITFLAIVPTMIDIRKEKIAVTIQGLE